MSFNNDYNNDFDIQQVTLGQPVTARDFITLAMKEGDSALYPLLLTHTEKYMKHLILILCLFGTTSAAYAQVPQQQSLPTAEDIMSGVIGNMSKSDAQLRVQIMQMNQKMIQMQSEIAKEKARADEAEKKLKDIPPKE
jgi:hypothetical protein